MKFQSQVYTKTSGSVGGLTYAHNKGGLYTRARRSPVNPNTVPQQTARAVLSLLVSNYTNLLTAAQRLLWDAYAQARTVIGGLGDPINLSGQQWYIKLNAPRGYAAVPFTLVPPLSLTQGTMSIPSIDVDASADTIDVTFNTADDWAGAVGGAMFVYCSRPQNPSVNFFAGPYQIAGKIDGAVIPPTSPATLPLPFAVGVGQKVFARIYASNADGLDTNQFATGAIAT